MEAPTAAAVFGIARTTGRDGAFARMRSWVVERPATIETSGGVVGDERRGDSSWRTDGALSGFTQRKSMEALEAAVTLEVVFWEGGSGRREREDCLGEEMWISGDVGCARRPVIIARPMLPAPPMKARGEGRGVVIFG